MFIPGGVRTYYILYRCIPGHSPELLGPHISSCANCTPKYRCQFPTVHLSRFLNVPAKLASQIGALKTYYVSSNEDQSTMMIFGRSPASIFRGRPASIKKMEPNIPAFTCHGVWSGLDRHIFFGKLPGETMASLVVFTRIFHEKKQTDGFLAKCSHQFWKQLQIRLLFFGTCWRWLARIILRSHSATGCNRAILFFRSMAIQDPIQWEVLYPIRPYKLW